MLQMTENEVAVAIAQMEVTLCGSVWQLQQGDWDN